MRNSREPIDRFCRATFVLACLLLLSASFGRRWAASYRGRLEIRILIRWLVTGNILISGLTPSHLGTPVTQNILIFRILIFDPSL